MNRIKEFLVACFQVCAVVGIVILMQFTIYLYDYAMWEKKNCIVMGNENVQTVKVCKDGLLNEEFTYTLANDEVLELKINVKKQLIETI
jgi:hypothetical protein